MADWTRVWTSPTGDAGCGGDCTCISNGLTSNPSASSATVFEGLPTSVQSVGAAINIWMERLRRRLDARTCLMTTQGTGAYTAVLDRFAVVLSIAASGRFPVTVQYTKPGDTGTAQFDTFDAMLDWLVERLH